MKALRTISKLLTIPPIIVLLYDIVNEWVTNYRFHLRSLDDWGKFLSEEKYNAFRPYAMDLLTPGLWEKWASLPAPLALIIPSVILYPIYWIWFKVKGGHTTGAYTYKSHD